MPLLPLLIAVLGLLAPRVVILVLAVFTDFMGRAYAGLLVPLIGFFLLPATTLAYAAAQNFAGGVQGGFWILVMIVAVLVDLSAWRWGRWRRVT
jgi:hypothetical protein